MKLDQLSTESLKEIIKLAKDEGVLELMVEGKDFKVSVQLNAPNVLTNKNLPHGGYEIPNHSTPPTVPQSHSSKNVDSSLHLIKSPFVGTFYASPSPGKPPYVKVGDKVKTGQALCVLEAMKIMNEIDSDMSGEIVEVCVEDESLVEFGQVLFKIKA